MKATPRKPAADRRLEITRAVFRIIGTSGFSALTTATLAEEVGVTGGALYRHFASLDEILVEAVREGVAKIEGTFPDPSTPPIDRLLALARNRVQLLGKDPGLAWLLRSDQAFLALPDEAVELLRAVIRRSRTFLIGCLNDGADDGSIRDDIDPELLLVPVVATIHAVIGRGAAARDRARGGEPSPEEILLVLAHLLEPPQASPPASTRTQRPSARKSTKKETVR